MWRRGHNKECALSPRSSVRAVRPAPVHRTGDAGPGGGARAAGAALGHAPDAGGLRDGERRRCSLPGRSSGLQWNARDFCRPRSRPRGAPPVPTGRWPARIAGARSASSGRSGSSRPRASPISPSRRAAVVPERSAASKKVFEGKVLLAAAPPGETERSVGIRLDERGRPVAPVRFFRRQARRLMRRSGAVRPTRRLPGRGSVGFPSAEDCSVGAGASGGEWTGRWVDRCGRCSSVS